MNNIDFNFFYKEELPVDKAWGYSPDLFLSAYNPSERVTKTYRKINAVKKYWIIQREYALCEAEYPAENFFICNVQNQNKYQESDFAHELLDSDVGKAIAQSESICIDITGFIKPYMMALLFQLENMGKKRIDILFSEPSKYKDKANTKFAGNFFDIRPVAGYGGVGLSTGTEKEILVIGAGYDNNLIAGIADEKTSAVKKIQILGFPSLRADMYQENVLRVDKAANAVNCHYGTDDSDFYRAPANDPFATASILQKIFSDITPSFPNASWYLCPLSTKPQALGFCLFYLLKCKNKPICLIYPFGKTHEAETGEGFARCWKYSLEF